MFSDMHIVAGMSRSIDLLEQSQRIARVGSWEWIKGDEDTIWTDEMFELLELEVTDSNTMPVDTILKHIHPEDLHAINSIRRRLFKDGSIQIQQRWITAKGKVLYIQCWCKVFLDSEGNLLKVRGICQDISSYKQLEEQLEKKTRALMRAEQFANSGTFQVNLTTRNNFYSDNFYRIHDYEPGEVPALPECFECLIYPCDQNFLKEQYKDLIAKPGPYDLQYRIISAKGTLKYLHIRGVASINMRGEVVFEGTLKDISDWQEIEDRLERENGMLKRAEETARVGSWKYNFVTRKIYHSDNLIKLLNIGSAKRDSLSVEEIFHKIPQDGLGVIRLAYKQTLEDGKERSVSFRLRNPDGSLSHFTISGKMAQNRMGEQIIVGTIQDISDQYLLNKQLADRSDFIQRLIDSSVNYISVVDQNGKYVLWNKKCEQVYGISKKDVIGKSVSQVFREIDIEWLTDGIEKALRGETILIEKAPSVTGKNYEVHLIPLKNATGNTENVFILAHDITKLSSLNEELKKQRDFAEAVVDHSEACIFVFDNQLRIVSCNRKCEELYGISRKKIAGLTLPEVFPNSDVSQSVERLKKALKGATLHYTEVSSAILDKTFDYFVIPMKDETGKVTSILAILNDITDISNASKRALEVNRLLQQKKVELRERNNFLETLLDIGVDLVEVYDRDLRLIEINRASLLNIGRSKDEAVGKTIYELFPGIEGSSYLNNLKNALCGIASYNVEFTSQRGDRILLGSQIPFMSNGKIIGALTVGSDITALKQTMKALEELNDQLAAKNQELNRINSELASFSYIASHDLQEPLRKIQAFISLIRAKDLHNLSDAASDYFERIQSAANRMQQMIEGLLSFSRTNTEVRDFESKDLHSMVQTVFLRFQDEIKAKQAIVEASVPHALSVIPHQFEQMLEQIVSNSLKFQQEGNIPHIEVRSDIIPGSNIEGEVAQRNTQYCRISVKDNGLGFDIDNVEKIFQMFHRLHGKTEFPGTGIGLAICRRIALNHEGFITVESEPGIGSTFHVYIPCEQTEH